MMVYHLYGKMAQQISDTTLVVGRTTIQKFAETYMIQDVLNKLELTKHDTLLEIGCGMGTLLFPFSLIVKEAYGIDHPALITRLKNSPYPENCSLLAGNWLEDGFQLPEMTKILIYNVIQHACSFEKAITFIEKALPYLPLGGKLLVGDIPNTSRKKRFEASEDGRQFNQWWNEQRAKFKTEEEKQRDKFLDQEIRRDGQTNAGFDMENKLVYFEFTDDMILDTIRHFRKMGHECYTLPQPTYLPFGYTREDLLIVKGT